MQKLSQVLIVIAVVVVLFIPWTQRTLNPTVGSILLICSLSYGISLIFGTEIPPYRRWAIGYLVFSGLTYLLVGLLGQARGSGLIVANVWYHLISPGPLLAVLGGLIHPFSFDIYRLHYWIFPGSESGENGLSIFAILVGSIAVAAGFAMGRTKTLGYLAWLVLVVLSGFAALSYVVAQFGKWGAPQYIGPNDSTTTIGSLLLAASYFAAYFTAKKGVKLRPR
ncbi:MAG TPA: hypothetical protein VJY15_23480 [Candidatus Acidoferrum sp.]|nr:hypothetical protein [Candidatus Acidoferrum sp.]